MYAPMRYEALFDHETDPIEMNNRYGDPRCADVRERMGGELIRMAQETNDPLIEPVRTACSSP